MYIEEASRDYYSCVHVFAFYCRRIECPELVCKAFVSV